MLRRLVLRLYFPSRHHEHIHRVSWSSTYPHPPSSTLIFLHIFHFCKYAGFGVFFPHSVFCGLTPQSVLGFFELFLNLTVFCRRFLLLSGFGPFSVAFEPAKSVACACTVLFNAKLFFKSITMADVVIFLRHYEEKRLRKDSR